VSFTRITFTVQGLQVQATYIVRFWAVIASAAMLVSPVMRVSQLRADDASLDPQPVSFHNDVKPIFSQHCFGCHQGAKQLGSYVMTDFASLVAGGETEQAAVVSGEPEESHLLTLVTSVDGHAEMPKEPFEPLSDVEVDTIRRWIVEGAADDSPQQDGPKYDAEHPPVYLAAPSIPSIDVSPDGELIAIAGFHEVVVLSADGGEIKSRLVGMSPRINSVRFSPDGQWIAAAGGTPAVRGELQIWEVKSGELSLSLPITYDALSGASWSPDGTKVAFGASDNVVRAVDATSGAQLLFQGAHEDWVRDTAFTADGKHLISVGRDMSCKLTEVETERFVDNITSITPGALSGGMSSVVAHPQRDEIVVGGADGVAKVFRVFRVSARKIGDNANLVRTFPQLPGRIICVAISGDAKRLAAVSTLDGRSEVRVWEYDFDGTLTDELKKILEKRVADRSDEEKKKVAAYQGNETTEIYRFPIETAAVYAIEFAPDRSLFVAGCDGKIRHLGLAGNLVSEFAAIPLGGETKIAQSAFDARAWNETLTRRIEEAATDQPPSADHITELIVQPADIELNDPYAYVQMVVTAELDDGSTIDVTRICDIETPDWTTVTSRGLLRPAGAGQSKLTVRYGQQTVAVNVTAANIEGQGGDQGAVDFTRDVSPILSRLGCNAGTCHGAQKGKNGFKLSLRGYDPVFDLRALTDDLAARRINAAAPEESLMLRKPLGATPHQGGAVMVQGDPNHMILRRWIADGCRLDIDAPSVSGIEVFPVNPIVQSNRARQQVRVVAHYTDGSERDVTPEAFIESGNTEVATADKSGLLTAVRRGEAPILARFEGAYAATTLTVMGDRSGYETPATDNWSRIDELVAEKWQRVKVVPSELCDDATFLRRVYLDLTGLPPSSDQVRAFLEDPSPTRDKRSQVIDELIGSEAFVEYWTNKWADLLQVNRKFLGVEGSIKFRDWIRAAVAENRPYDQFAREILTATGSNNENPAASYFKVLRNADDTMENTTHLFLGIRFNCNKCHDHPFERWTQNQYYELSAFFAQVGLEADPASGKRKVGGTAVEGAKPLFEKVFDKKEGEVKHPTTSEIVAPEFPFPVPHEASQDATRREQLASWMTDADNPYFAHSYVNRLWGYLLGAGLIEPIDDIRAGNPPTNPDLLDHLASTFVESGFDTRHTLKAICNSRTYQLSVATNPLNEDDAVNYSHALPRRLPAEVIYDTVHAVTGAVSAIPGMPAGTRAAAVTDSGVKLADGFLQSLGRPTRESACECERNSDLQLGPVMALISGPTISAAIADPKNELERIVEKCPDDPQLAEEIFLRALGRLPTEPETDAFGQMIGMIKQDHQDLIAELELAEAQWKERRVELEAERERKLAATLKQIETRTEEIKPERERLEKERQDKIKAAEQVVAKAKEKSPEKLSKWEADLKSSGVEWFPLAVSSASASNKATLRQLADRSILASGNKDKGIYTITVKTTLKNITGFRLETLTDPSLPTLGPGLPPNGNFVLTEFVVRSAPAGEPAKKSDVKIASGVADFLQGGFSAEATFDGKTNDQGGWAVAGATGMEHWATYKLASPIAGEGGTVLTFQLHQFHNAAEHRLGRFRISATTADGEIPLGQPESFAAILSQPEASRSDESKKVLDSYLAVTDAEVRKANDALAVTKRPVPPDEKLQAFQQRKESLSKPTSDDPNLVRLRDDTKQSTSQLEKIRLTAAEDLTWALINSPAFLFNH
jgi:WD40 repeat protein